MYTAQLGTLLKRFSPFRRKTKKLLREIQHAPFSHLWSSTIVSGVFPSSLPGSHGGHDNDTSISP
jgi:hypothetical protein